MKLSVSAIVPFLNEEKTISKVVSILLESRPLINEVICVTDGSTDKSADILKKEFKNKIKLIVFKKNRGKGFAMAEGVKAAKGNIILFMDADITNLTVKDVRDLIMPLQKSNVRVVLGYPAVRYSVAKFMLPLTGERAYYKKDILSHVKNIAKKGYVAEVYLNEMLKNYKTEIVPLPHLFLLEKWEKYGPVRVIKDSVREHFNVYKEFLKMRLSATRKW